MPVTLNPSRSHCPLPREVEASILHVGMRARLRAHSVSLVVVGLRRQSPKAYDLRPTSPSHACPAAVGEGVVTRRAVVIPNHRNQAICSSPAATRTRSAGHRREQRGGADPDAEPVECPRDCSSPVARAMVVSELCVGPGRSKAMAHISGEVMIEAPVEEVFDLVADERNEPRYNPRIVQCRKAERGAGRPGFGASWPSPRAWAPRGRMTLEVLEYERPHRLHNIVRSSYMKVEGTLTFEETDVGTRLRWEWEMGMVGPMKLMSPALALVGPRWERRNWVSLKQFVESGRR